MSQWLLLTVLSYSSITELLNIHSKLSKRFRSEIQTSQLLDQKKKLKIKVDGIQPDDTRDLEYAFQICQNIDIDVKRMNQAQRVIFVLLIQMAIKNENQLKLSIDMGLCSSVMDEQTWADQFQTIPEQFLLRFQELYVTLEYDPENHRDQERKYLLQYFKGFETLTISIYNNPNNESYSYSCSEQTRAQIKTFKNEVPIFLPYWIEDLQNLVNLQNLQLKTNDLQFKIDLSLLENLKSFEVDLVQGELPQFNMEVFDKSNFNLVMKFHKGTDLLSIFKCFQNTDISLIEFEVDEHVFVPNLQSFINKFQDEYLIGDTIYELKQYTYIQTTKFHQVSFGQQIKNLEHQNQIIIRYKSLHYN